MTIFDSAHCDQEEAETGKPMTKDRGSTCYQNICLDRLTLVRYQYRARVLLTGRRIK